MDARNLVSGNEIAVAVISFSDYKFPDAGNVFSTGTCKGGIIMGVVHCTPGNSESGVKRHS